MTKTKEQILAAIDNTIAARKEQLPTIKAERSRVSQQLSSLNGLQRQLEGLLAAGIDEAVTEEVNSAKATLEFFADVLEGYRDALDELEAEFTRDTLNIGVSGAARTGKSTTLQHITGLTNRQIPCGEMNPVTAVRSEYYNSSRNEAVVTFKSERDFIEGYVRPHVANVNACLGDGEKLSIGSLAALKAADLPEKLGSSVDTAATDSLKRLREAKRSVSSYEGYLGKAPATVNIDDVAGYVTYPNAADEQVESIGGAVADRRYLAVELTQVYCQYPNLGDAKVCLVDLPGLGEIGNSASDIHLKGLESKVDQILLVMKPSKEKAFADHEVACNLDQLLKVQPAVGRGDLIVAGINRDESLGRMAVDNLRSHFEAEINAGRTDPYSILDYCAVDDADVARMFGVLLERLGTLLPEMDRQKVTHCMGSVNLSTRIESAAEGLVRSMDRVLRSIPSSHRVMKERIDAIEREVVGQLNAYAVELTGSADSDSEAFREFVADAQRIHGEVADRISDGLFRSCEDEWLELTSSSRDYYNLYRDECKRIRYEVIDAYCGLDRFYGAHLSNFKLRVLDTFLRSCGMGGFFGFSAMDAAEKRIAKVASEFGSTLHDDDLDRALRMLADMRFDFRSNVALQIDDHLAELANPSEVYRRDKCAKEENKRKVLGGDGSSEAKRDHLREYLRHDASKANDAILAALKKENDRFNKYLAISIDFFNNYLFGKDEENFKQVVIRGLIQEYKEHVLPDVDDASKSPLGAMAREVKDMALSLKSGGGAIQERRAAAVSATKPVLAKRAEGNVDGFTVNQELTGKVNRVEEDRAYVTLGDGYGIVFKSQVSNDWVDDVRDILCKGQVVRVKVIELDRERGNVLLSMKQCA